jgi:hypothetical protein
MKMQAVLTALRAWYAALPAGIARLSEESDGYGPVLRLEPRTEGGATVEFRLSTYGKFAFYVGKAGLFDEVEASPELAVEVCEAVRRGQVVDHVRTWRGRELAALTEVKLPSGRLLRSRVVRPAGFLPIGRRKRIAYAAWA